MTGSLHSAQWHRVAALRPALAPQVRVRRQRVRGVTWWLLSDPVSGRSCRLDRAAYELAARFDGSRSVQSAWDAQQARRDDAPTQDDTLELVARLREQGLIDPLGPGAAPVAHGGGSDTPEAGARAPRSLLAWRVPLVRPDAALRRMAWWSRYLFAWPAAALLALTLAWLAVAAVVQAPALWDYAGRWAATPRFAIVALLAYLPMKLLHEIAHGLALQHLGGPHGGRVTEAGVTFMFGLPMPYVDASAVASWPDRWRRMAVAAAGIVAELAMAALALAAWIGLDDGLAREIAFAVFALGGVSTLMFNANPLQRMDGYFILCDALQLPNLATRSRAWWHTALSHRLLQPAGQAPMPVARGEAPWLAGYAPLSWLWSLVIAAAAVAWLGAMSAPLGAAAGALLAIQLVVVPAWSLWRRLQRLARAQAAPVRRLRMAGVALGLLALGVLAVPLPRHSVAQGVVWPPDHAQLRADADGFVAQVLARDGQPVQAGDAVLVLDNPRLVADHEQAQARLRGLLTEFLDVAKAASADGQHGGQLRAELQAAQAEVDLAQQRLAGLTVRAGAAGQLALPDAADLPGQFVERGRLVGQVLTGEPPLLRVAVPADEARLLRDRARGAVSVRLADAPQQPHDGRLMRDGGGAVSELPSAAFSTHHGGAILTDPQDDTHRRTTRPVVLVDVQWQLQPDAAAPRLGTRGWARMDQGWAPWGWQLAEGLERAWQRVAHPAR